MDSYTKFRDAITDKSITSNVIKRFSTEIITKFNNVSSKEIAIRDLTVEPWNPLLLEWEILLQPLRDKTNVEESAKYDPEMISSYTLDSKSADFDVIQSPNLASGKLYSNSCILTSHASTAMMERIAEYLSRYLILLKEELNETTDRDKWIKELLNLSDSTSQEFSEEQLK